MINRRNVRIKVMQALYSWQNGLQQNGIDEKYLQKDLFKSIEGFYRLHLYNLYFLLNIAEYAVVDFERRTSKYLPTETDKKLASKKLYENPIIRNIEENEDFQRLIKKEKLTSLPEKNLVKKLFLELRETEPYQEYIAAQNTSEKEHKYILKYLLTDILFNSADYDHHLEDNFPTWYDDKEFLIKKLQQAIQENNPNISPPAQWEEQVKFGYELLYKTLQNNQMLEELIIPKAKNWEAERIAQIDMILMKLALAEMLFFPTIPPKVSIDEYLDVAKNYSTPKSKDFINGILDRLMKDLKEEGRIHKTGRGLIE